MVWVRCESALFGGDRLRRCDQTWDRVRWRWLMSRQGGWRKVAYLSQRQTNVDVLVRTGISGGRD